MKRTKNDLWSITGQNMTNVHSLTSTKCDVLKNLSVDSPDMLLNCPAHVYLNLVLPVHIFDHLSGAQVARGCGMCLARKFLVSMADGS